MSEPEPVRVALLQINPTVGDLDGNARLIADAARAAWQQGARVALARALADCEGLHLVVGHPWDGGAAGHGDDVRSKSVSVPKTGSIAQ